MMLSVDYGFLSRLKSGVEKFLENKKSVGALGGEVYGCLNEKPSMRVKRLNPMNDSVGKIISLNTRWVSIYRQAVLKAFQIECSTFYKMSTVWLFE